MNFNNLPELISKGASAFACVALVVVAGACKPKIQTTPVGNKPKIQIVGGDTVNWGRLPPGILKKTMKVTNVGGGVLKIADVHPSCGCTTAPLDKKILNPGDTATIQITVDVGSASGEIHKYITITSNDSSRPSIAVPLSAFLVRDVTVEPHWFPIPASGPPGEEEVSSVYVHNMTDSTLKFDVPEILEPVEMTVKFDNTAPFAIAPRDSAKITVHATPLREGVLSTDVVLPNNSTSDPQLRVRLTINAVKK